MDTAELILEFSQNPHGFFWILKENDSNPNLNKLRQSQVWRRVLIELNWPEASKALDNTELIMISDNGDYVFTSEKETFRCDPRGCVIERFKMNPSTFLRNIKTIKSKIIPQDMQE